MQNKCLRQKDENEIEELEYEIGQLKRKQNEYVKKADVLKNETYTNANLFSPRNYRLKNREKLEQIDTQIGKIKTKLEIYEQQLENLKNKQLENTEMLPDTNRKVSDTASVAADEENLWKKTLTDEKDEKLEFDTSITDVEEKQIEHATVMDQTTNQLETDVMMNAVELNQEKSSIEQSKSDTMPASIELEGMEHVVSADETVNQLSLDLMTDTVKLEQLEKAATADKTIRETEKDTLTDAEKIDQSKLADAFEQKANEQKTQPSIWIQELTDESSTESTEKQFCISENGTDDSSACHDLKEEYQGYDFDEVSRERALATSRIADGLKKLQLKQDIADTIEYQLPTQQTDSAVSEKTEPEISTDSTDVSSAPADEMEIKSEEVIILESEQKKEREFLEQIYLKVERSLAMLNGNRNVCKKELQQVKRMIYDYVQKLS